MNIKAGSANHRAITATISLVVYLLVVLTGEMSLCKYLNINCHDSHQSCGVENSLESSDLFPAGNSAFTNIFVYSSCDTCFSTEKYLDEHERFISNVNPGIKYSDNNTSGTITSLFSNFQSRHNIPADIRFTSNPDNSLSTIVLLI